VKASGVAVCRSCDRFSEGALSALTSGADQ